MAAKNICCRMRLHWQIHLQQICPKQATTRIVLDSCKELESIKGIVHFIKCENARCLCVTVCVHVLIAITFTAKVCCLCTTEAASLYSFVCLSVCVCVRACAHVPVHES